MTPEQKIHMAFIAGEAYARITDKYEKGQAEHGGNLWDQSSDQLLENAIMEAVDQVIYLLTIREKRMKDLSNAAARR